MGLNTGITVTMREPLPLPRAELEELLYQHLVNRFPQAAPGRLFGCSIEITGKDTYDFDIRFAHYARDFRACGYTHAEMEDAIRTFLLTWLPHDGLRMSPYFVP